MIKLTKREEQIILLVASGFRDRDIGQKLEISSETVKSHVKKIMVKTSSRTRSMAVAKFTLARADAIAFALREV